MRKFIRVMAFAITLCILLLALPVFAASQSDAGVPKQTSASVKLYSMPGSGSALASLKSGEVVLAYYESGRYTLVEYGGKSGYIETRRLRSVSSSAKSAGVAIANTAVTLYKEASTSASKAATAKSGAVFTILAQGTDYLVLRNGKVVGCAPASSFALYTSNSEAESYAMATKSASILSDTGKSAPKLTTASSGELIEVLKQINSTYSVVKRGTTVGVMSMKNTQAFTQTTGTVQASSNATVYRGASTKLTKLGSLKKGALAESLGTYGSYTVIRFEGAAGCVATKNVKEAAASGSSQSGASQSGTEPIRTNYVEAIGKIDVYSRASKSSTVMGALYDGSIVRYYGSTSDGTWVGVEYSGYLCYVERANVKESAYTPGDAVGAGEYDDAALELIAYMNDYRKQEGASALSVSDALMKAAVIRANEITVKFSHTRPNGQNCNTVDPDNIFGENIAMGSAVPTAQSAAKAFMSSTEHKVNAMRTNFKSTGAACVKVGDALYWVQLFGY